MDDEVSYGELSRAASKTAHEYLFRAIESVEYLMGKGAAKANPEIIAALINAASTDYLAAMLSHRVRPGLDGIADAIRDAGDAVRAGLDE